MTMAPPGPPHPTPPDRPTVTAIPKSVATLGTRGPDVVKLATEAALRVVQVRAASIAASKAIAAERAKAEGS